jgi:hypothetical protein
MTYVIVTEVEVTVGITVDSRVIVDVSVAPGKSKSVQNCSIFELWIMLITLRMEGCKQGGIDEFGMELGADDLAENGGTDETRAEDGTAETRKDDGGTDDGTE